MEAGIFLVKIVLYTIVGLSFLYVIYKATLSLLQKTGLSAKLKIREGKFLFKDMRINGYEYHESTYTMTEYADALIRKDDILLIQSLIPIYNRKKSYVFKILQYIIDHTKQNLGIYDSILYQAYCNGFKTGFWRLDEIIFKCKIDSTETLNDKFQKYLNKHKIKAVSNHYSRNGAHSILQLCINIGKQQGATVRKIQFEIDNVQETRILIDILININEQQKVELMCKVKKHLSDQAKGLKIGLLYIALQELNLIANGKNSFNEIEEATFFRVLKNTGLCKTSVKNSMNKYSHRENLSNENINKLNRLIETLNPEK